MRFAVAIPASWNDRSNSSTRPIGGGRERPSVHFNYMRSERREVFMPESPEIGSIPDIVRFWAAQSPANVALICDTGAVSYGLLNQRSNQIANRMLAAGVQPRSHVGYLGMNSDSFFDAWFGSGKIGCAFAPFNWRLSPAELAEIIDDAEPDIIFVDASFSEKIHAVR